MSRSSKRRKLLGLALTLGCQAGFGAPATALPPAALVEAGGRLPDLALNGLNGPDRQLGAYRGRPLIINVWASWCGPCRAEAASLERLAWTAMGRSVVVIGVSTDDHRVAAERWLKQSNATLSHFLDHDLLLERTLGADRIPTTVLVDAQGVVVDRIHGAREWDSPESVRLIQRALSRPARTR